MEETITGYSAKAAYLTREENIKGMLEPGKLADIVVLSDDPLTLDPEKILDVQVLMTIVTGRWSTGEAEAGARRWSCSFAPIR